MTNEVVLVVHIMLNDNKRIDQEEEEKKNTGFAIWFME